MAWIVGGQVLALMLARRAGIDSDAPRGLRKFLGSRREAADMAKIAIIYYSSTGNAYKVAQAIEWAHNRPAPRHVLRKVRELAPDEAIASNKGWEAHRVATQHVQHAELSTSSGPTASRSARLRALV